MKIFNAQKEMVVKGSHDTMTYLRAAKWWARLFPCFWRTQRRSVKEQIERGANVLDLRVVRDDNGYWGFAHGIVDLDKRVKLFSLLTEIKELRPGIIIRLILERSYNDDIEFKLLCGKLESMFPELTFIGGWRKRGWKLLYDFKGNAQYPESGIHQHCGSMAQGAKWYERFMPRKWFVRNGHPATKEGLNLYDFY